MIVGFEVVKVEMKCSLVIKNGFCCSHCCAEFRHFFLSLIKGLDAVDKICQKIFNYFALKYPNNASVNANMSGTAISTLKSITVDPEKTVKNRVNKTAVAIT